MTSDTFMDSSIKSWHTLIRPLSSEISFCFDPTIQQLSQSFLLLQMLLVFTIYQTYFSLDYNYVNKHKIKRC